MDIIKFDAVSLALNPFVLMFITADFSIISFALVCLAGYLLGSARIFMGPLGYVSLESTGGVLIGSLGLGAATDAVGSDDPGAGYGATYPFALFGMVIFTIVIMKLPLL